MANINFGSTPGLLFPILGKIGLVISQCDSYQNSQLTNITDTTNGLIRQLNGEPDIQAIVGSSYIGLLNSPGSSVSSLVQNLARRVVNRIVYLANPLISQTLQTLNVTASIDEIILQMNRQSYYVTPTTLAITVGDVFRNGLSSIQVGNGVIVASTRSPLDGLVQENTLAETLELTITNDSFVGGSTAGNESWLVQGTGSANYFDFNWPLGSNLSATGSVIDGNVDNASGNLLTNSGFTTWTGGVPDKHTLRVGVAGTDIAQETTITYDGVSSLRLTGDGSTFVRWDQKFDDSGGTLGELDPLTSYGFNIFARNDGTAAAAGVLRIRLVDGPGGSVVNDAAGNANSFTIDLTSLSTTWTSFSTTFRTPYVMPSTIYIEYTLTTALTITRRVYLDKASLGLQTNTHPSGIYLSVHAGSIHFKIGDYNFNSSTGTKGIAIANTKPNGFNDWNTLWARLFPDEMYGSGRRLPVTGVNLIPFTLIS